MYFAYWFQLVFDGVNPQCTTDALLLYQKKYNVENNGEIITDNNIAYIVSDLMRAGTQI